MIKMYDVNNSDLNDTDVASLKLLKIVLLIDKEITFLK